jgi:hypothetical protein
MKSFTSLYSGLVFRIVSSEMDQRELGLSLIWRPFSFWLSVVSSETLGNPLLPRTNTISSARLFVFISNSI